MPKPTTKKLDNQDRLKGTFITVIDLDTLRAASKGGDKLPKRIPVLPKGEFMTQPYGNMVLDNNIFEQMIGNFNGNVRKAVPLDVDHAWENTRAGGWLTKLMNEDDGLWAEVDYTPFGAELVENREYRMISAEWSFDYIDPQKSTHHGAVLVAATLTNRPLMQSMPTITASEKNLTNTNGLVLLLNEDNKTSMPTLTEILAKAVADRTEEDLKFLQENEAELTDEQKEQLEQETADAKADADLEEAKKKEQEEADAKAKAEAEAAGKTPEEIAKEAEEKEAANKDETIKAGELKRLQKIEAEFKAAEVLKAAEEFSKPFLASNDGGKVLPAGKDALIKLSQTLNDSQRALLTSVLNATADQKVTKVAGQDNKDGLTATEQYNKLVKELMDSGKSASEANKEIRKAHNDVYKAFLAENK